MMEKPTIEAIVRSGNFVVLDTETTGLRYPSEIVEIAIISSMGEVLINTRVKPTGLIPAQATAIHGITDQQVANAPLWSNIRRGVLGAIGDKYVLVYNADYDRMLVDWTDNLHGIKDSAIDPNNDWECVMKWYAVKHGEYDDFHGSYRWQKLGFAMAQNDLRVVGAHGALGDCRMTLALLNKLVRR